ncbi:hypothetical protein DY000_02004591 [Brassica cretica]|uniref:Zinc finger GRF-type domain-containing protein n=1 Tax=Brassica cretica TaxID=69181 RepID=A0ABQ7C869_BRACR|nr:hypothetical protein DY000_02004591 [Brassica cretica]
MTTSLGKDTSSAKTTRMTGCISGNHGCATRDEEDTYDYLPRKRYFICKDYQNDGLHFRQPWVCNKRLRGSKNSCLYYLSNLLIGFFDVCSGPVPEPEERPIGLKAASKRKKTGKEEELAKLEGMLEIKKQISKQSLLDRLLAKPEPLFEMELALKMKLMSEMTQAKLRLRTLITDRERLKLSLIGVELDRSLQAGTQARTI